MHSSGAGVGGGLLSEVKERGACRDAASREAGYRITGLPSQKSLQSWSLAVGGFSTTVQVWAGALGQVPHCRPNPEKGGDLLQVLP